MSDDSLAADVPADDDAVDSSGPATAVADPSAGSPDEPSSGPAADAGLRPRGPVMMVLALYRQAADRFAGLLGWISAILIFPTVTISVTNVVLRRVGASTGQNLTSNALIEAQWYLYGLIFVFGFAYILRDGINVRVDFWFSERSSRTQSWIDLVGHCIALLPFAYIGIRYSWPSVELSWQQGEQSPDAGGLFRPPIKTALMAAFVFLAIQGVAEIIRNVEYLRGHEYRHDDDNPALAGGQTFSVDDFAVADTGFRGDGENGDHTEDPTEEARA